MFPLFIVFYLLSESILCLNYFVDCNQETDNGNGQNEGSAWKTLTKLNQEVSSGKFAPGDNIFLRSGCTFIQQYLNLSSIKGTFDSPITITSFGEGEAPIIDCSLPIEAVFELNGENEYSATFNRNEGITQLFVDSIPYNISHYPRRHIDFLFTRNEPGVTGLIKVREGDFSFLSNYQEKVNGSRVCVRAHQFTWRCRDVVNVNYTNPLKPDLVIEGDGGRVGYSSKLRGYKLTNKLWMLGNGDWFFDDHDKRLYVKMLDGLDANDVDIRISDQDYGIILEENEHLVIENITIQYPRSSGVQIQKNTYHVVFRNIEVSYSAHTAVYFSAGYYRGENISDVTIENSRFLDNGVRGIVMWNKEWRAPFGRSEKVKIIRNSIERTFLNPMRINHKWVDDGYWGQQHGTAIVCEAAYSLVELNSVIDSGYIGVYFYDRVDIIRNFFNNTCLFLDDCGSIYLYGEVWHGNARIHQNVVKNAWGNKYGTSCFLSSCFNSTTGRQAHGIYLDNMSTNISVTNNFVYNTEIGLFANKPLNNVWRDNVAIYSANWGFQTNDYFNANSLNLNASANIVERNIIHTFKSTILYMGNSEFNWTNHCRFTNNYLLSSDEGGTARINALLLNLIGAQNDRYVKHDLDLNQRENDSGNKFFPLQWFETEKYFFESLSGNMFENPSFDFNISGWTSHYNEPGEIIQEWSQEYGGTLKMYKNHPGSTGTDYFISIWSNQFDVVDGMQYILKFSGISSVSERIYCFITGTDFAEHVYFKNQMIIFEYKLLGTSNSTSKFSCYDGDHNVVFHFDNFSLVATTNIIEEHLSTKDFDWIYNAEIERKYFVLDEERCDIEGNIVGKEFWLEPRESLFFMKCFDNEDSQCNNHENANTSPDVCEPYCGNLICEPGEDMLNCPSDCLFPVCGNQVCEPWENMLNCSSDCLIPVCGNGECEPLENALNCSDDCDPICGNGVCEPTEYLSNCPEDDCPPSPAQIASIIVVAVALFVIFFLVGIFVIVLIVIFSSKRLLKRIDNDVELMNEMNEGKTEKD